MNEDQQQRPSEAAPPPAPWAFKGESSPGSASFLSDGSPAPDPEAIRWTASEFIAHNKGVGWYLVLMISAIILAALAYLISRDVVSTVVVIVVAIFLAILASRQPRILQYEVSAKGFTVGQHFYPYGTFKSFSVLQEGAFSSILFMPLKRFTPPITIYYTPADESRIIQVISSYLPLAPPSNDLLDKFLERIRF